MQSQPDHTSEGVLKDQSSEMATTSRKRPAIESTSSSVQSSPQKVNKGKSKPTGKKLNANPGSIALVYPTDRQGNVLAGGHEEIVNVHTDGGYDCTRCQGYCETRRGIQKHAKKCKAVQVVAQDQGHNAGVALNIVAVAAEHMGTFLHRHFIVVEQFPELVIDRHIRAFFCVRCKVYKEGEGISNHLQTKGHAPGRDAAVNALRNAADTSKLNVVEIKDELMNVLNLHKIAPPRWFLEPVVNGWWCTPCNLGFTSDRGFQRHVKEFHPTHFNEILSNCPLQKVTHTNVAVFRRVTRGTVAEHPIPQVYFDAVPGFGLLQPTLEEMDRKQHPRVARTLDLLNLLKRIGVDSPTMLHQILELPLEDELVKFREVFGRFMHAIRDAACFAATTHPGLLVTLAKDSSTQRRFGILTENSQGTYANVLCQLLVFVFRVCGCVQGEHYQIPDSPVKANVQELGLGFNHVY
jgi:hypothetical protein